MLAQLQNLVDVPGAVEDDVATIKGLEVIFNNVVYVVLGIAGIVLFVMLVIGGFSFITAGSEAPKAEAAKKTITFAILGMVFIALSFLILRLIETFTGANVTEFRITQ